MAPTRISLGYGVNDMGKRVIAIASRNGVIDRIEDADKLVFYDMDTGSIDVIDNPYRKGFIYLEELFEERDPSILIVNDIGEELMMLIEETGVHVIKYPSRSVESALKELFI